MKITEYHPFKSVEAKEKYLKMYDEKAKKWPVPSETKFVDTSYGKTFVRISGQKNNLPMVLLHGMGSNSLTWWPPHVKTWSNYYRIYAIDIIYQHGRSIHTKDVNNLNDFLIWLDELFDALHLDKVNLVGLSYGRWLTGQYALHNSDKLSKIVMIAPAATVLPLGKEVIEQMIKHRDSPRDFIFWMYEDLVHKDEASLKEAETIVEESILSSSCFNFIPTLAPTVMEDHELQDIKVPALFIMGENEKNYSAKKAVERLNTVAPQIKTEVIPNAGHNLCKVQADMVNKDILEFLNEE